MLIIGLVGCLETVQAEVVILKTELVLRQNMEEYREFVEVRVTRLAT